MLRKKKVKIRNLEKWEVCNCLILGHFIEILVVKKKKGLMDYDCYVWGWRECERIWFFDLFNLKKEKRYKCSGNWKVRRDEV